MSNENSLSFTLEMVLQNALKIPQKIAVDNITYGELGRRICGLSSQIVGERVLIACSKGANAYIAMLSALHAGATYAPINLDAPKGRVQMVYDEFSPTDVVCDTDKKSNWPECLCVGRETDLCSQKSTNNPAYVIFTSGSTGKPKGVIISRNSMDHFVNWSIKSMGFDSSSRVSQHPNIAFDLSVMDIFSGLAAGSELFPLISNMDKVFPGRSIGDNNLTHWVSVPSVIDLMSRDTKLSLSNMNSLKELIFCGEPLLERHLEFVFDMVPNAEVINTYGPTEATVCMTSQKMTINNWKNFVNFGTVTLGKPTPPMAITLHGGKTDHEGEIIISGPQVSDGYWNSTELTKKSFNGDKYKTGDWAEIKDGNLYFRSRIDRQVKYQG